MGSAAPPVGCERIKARGRRRTQRRALRPEQRRAATQPAAARRVSAAGIVAVLGDVLIRGTNQAVSRSQRMLTPFLRLIAGATASENFPCRILRRQ